MYARRDFVTVYGVERWRLLDRSLIPVHLAIQYFLSQILVHVARAVELRILILQKNTQLQVTHNMSAPIGGHSFQQNQHTAEVDQHNKR